MSQWRIDWRVLTKFGRNTVLPEHSKTASFAYPYTLVATTMELKTTYNAKNGTPTAAALKAFFKWSYIIITREISGEMMRYTQLVE